MAAFDYACSTAVYTAAAAIVGNNTVATAVFVTVTASALIPTAGTVPIRPVLSPPAVLQSSPVRQSPALPLRPPLRPWRSTPLLLPRLLPALLRSLRPLPTQQTHLPPILPLRRRWIMLLPLPRCPQPLLQLLRQLGILSNSTKLWRLSDGHVGVRLALWLMASRVLAERAWFSAEETNRRVFSISCPRAAATSPLLRNSDVAPGDRTSPVEAHDVFAAVAASDNATVVSACVAGLKYSRHVCPLRPFAVLRA